MISSPARQNPIQSILEHLEESERDRTPISIEEINQYKEQIKKQIELIVKPLFGYSHGSSQSPLSRTSSPAVNTRSLREKEDAANILKQNISMGEEEIVSVSRSISAVSQELFSAEASFRAVERKIDFLLDQCARLSGNISSIDDKVNLEPIVLDEALVDFFEEQKSSRNDAISVSVESSHSVKESLVMPLLIRYISSLQDYTRESEANIRERDYHFKQCQLLRKKQIELNSEYHSKIRNLDQLTVDQRRLQKLINFSQIEMDSIQASVLHSSLRTPELIRMERVDIPRTSSEERGNPADDLIEQSLIGFGELDSSSLEQTPVSLTNYMNVDVDHNFSCKNKNNDTLKVILKSAALLGAGAGAGMLLFYFTPAPMFFLQSPVATYFIEFICSTLTLLLAKKSLSCILDCLYYKNNNSVTFFNSEEIDASPTILGRHLDQTYIDDDRISLARSG